VPAWTTTCCCLFGLPFAEVADTVGRTSAAVRQLAVRARAAAPRVAVDRDEHRAAVMRFLHATRGGDLRELLHALDPAVVLTTHGGGAVTDARRPVVGADRVARFLLGAAAAAAKRPEGRAQLVSVNGAPGLAIVIGDQVDSLIVLTFNDEQISRVDIIRAPDKIRAATSRRIEEPHKNRKWRKRPNGGSGWGQRASSNPTASLDNQRGTSWFHPASQSRCRAGVSLPED